MTSELNARVRKAAAAHELSASDWVRMLVVSACDEEERLSRLDLMLGRILRNIRFATTGIDALLASHPDPMLRRRAHEAFHKIAGAQGMDSISGEDDQ
ncbi:MAG: hypothetical protein IH997_05600 [Proteobacteria bacterium]|nr:hypothetical protein [Pseudomonadota bacterium]